MENHIYIGLISALGVIGFLLLASPTIRKELLRYFDLFSAHRKEKTEIRINFRCWKCGKINTAIIKLPENDVALPITELNCKFCTHLDHKKETATINIVNIPAPTGYRKM